MSKSSLSFSWCVSWQYVDRTEMFNAVRARSGAMRLSSQCSASTITTRTTSYVASK